MQIESKVLIISKILEYFKLNVENSFCAVFINTNSNYIEEIDSHSFYNMPELLQNFLAGKLIIEQEKSDIFKFSLQKYLFKQPREIGKDKMACALSIVLSAYLDCFFKPLQYHIPNSAACAGQWEFWDQIDYKKFLHAFSYKEIQEDFCQKMLQHKIWQTAILPEDFSFAVKKALEKRDMLNSPLDSHALIKAIIIRTGELSQLNYELIDLAVRRFFTQTKVDKYLRIDREMLFLRRLDKAIRDVVTCLL